MTDNTINKEPGTAVEKNCGNCGGCTAPNVPKLHTLFLGVTEDCNMRCRYCFVHHNPARMTLDTAMKA